MKFPFDKLPLERIPLLEEAIGSCKCGVTIADATAPDMPLIYINEAFENITGYAVRDVLGKNCRFLQGDCPDAAARSQIRQALATGSDLTIVLQNHRRDGTLFWNELHLSPVRRGGKLTHFIGIQNDITAEVEARQALQASEESLRQSNREKEALLGIAAHDLRNPMAMIKSLANLAGQADPQKAMEMISMMEDVADKALLLVGDILNLNAIQTGRLELNLQSVNLTEFLDHFSRSARSMCALKHIEFTAEPGPLPASATFDPNRIEQILDNLVANAVKYSHRETRVTLKARANGPWLLLSIADQGQGIPEKDLPRLFEPFTKAGPQPTEGEPSSGLGLAISKRLAELHGGTISVTSIPSQGSEFCIQIPLSPTPAAGG